jgi:hypothetical protein
MYCRTISRDISKRPPFKQRRKDLPDLVRWIYLLACISKRSRSKTIGKYLVYHRNCYSELRELYWQGCPGESDVWLVKTDARGYEQWNMTFGGTDRDSASSVTQSEDGGYILAGETYSYGAGQSDVWLVKTDSKGYEQWNKTFGGIDDDRAEAVQQTSDGGYILAGGTGSFGPGWSNVWLIKIDTNGNMQWNQTFGGTGGDWAESIQQTSDGGFIIAGTTTSYGAYGGYIIAGKTDSYRAGDADIWLIKLEGNLVYRINAPTTYIGCFNMFVERRLRAVGYKSYGIVRQT